VPEMVILKQSNFSLKKVLIPKGVSEFKAVDILNNTKIANMTIDLVEYGNDLGVEVIEVSSINEALYEFTGIVFKEDNGELEIDEIYIEIMSMLADELCNRSINLIKDIESIDRSHFKQNDSEIIYKQALNLTESAKEAINLNDYYSAASYCFGANVKYRNVLYREEDIKEKAIKKQAEKVKDIINDFHKILDSKKITKITDLQTYMIVKERLIEAQEALEKINENNNTLDQKYNLAYGIERVYSASSWSNFFNTSTQEFDLEEEDLKDSCREKIGEAEERYQYSKLIFPLTLENTKKEIQKAYADYEQGNYILCLFKASKAKAEADVILTSIGVEQSQLDSVIDQKLEILKRSIAKQIEKGIFPILGYSYYEYAKSLKESDKYSSMIFIEYGLELSNMDIYFQKNESHKFKLPIIRNQTIYGFLSGIGIGLIIAGITILIFKKTKNKSKKKHIRVKKIKRKKRSKK
jgi:uncharacterized protein